MSALCWLLMPVSHLIALKYVGCSLAVLVSLFELQVWTPDRCYSSEGWLEQSHTLELSQGSALLRITWD